MLKLTELHVRILRDAAEERPLFRGLTTREEMTTRVKFLAALEKAGYLKGENITRAGSQAITRWEQGASSAPTRASSTSRGRPKKSSVSVAVGATKAKAKKASASRR